MINNTYRDALQATLQGFILMYGKMYPCIFKRQEMAFKRFTSIVYIITFLSHSIPIKVIHMTAMI